MKSIFSYDSKFMEMLETLANTMLLNLLFLLSCLPVVTIGAAFTALFSACRAQTRGTPCFRAYFKAFRQNFPRATLVWLVLLVPVLACVWSAMVVWANGLSLGVFVLSVLGAILFLNLMSGCLLFYSRFECPFRQLLKNGMLMTLSYPIRSLLIAALLWFPVVAFFLIPYILVQLTVIWVFLYYGTAGALCVWLMKKPFARLAERLLGIVETEPTDEPAHPKQD